MPRWASSSRGPVRAIRSSRFECGGGALRRAATGLFHEIVSARVARTIRLETVEHNRNFCFSTAGPGVIIVPMDTVEIGAFGIREGQWGAEWEGRGREVPIFACKPLKSPDSEKEMKGNERCENGFTGAPASVSACRARSCKIARSGAPPAPAPGIGRTIPGRAEPCRGRRPIAGSGHAFVLFLLPERQIRFTNSERRNEREKATR